MPRIPRTWLLSLAAATAILAAPAPASAGPIVDPGPITPNQAFVGVVNGQSTDAVIQVDCPGPSVPGRLGYPLPYQYVRVLPATTPTPSLPGFTGSAGTAVNVFINPTASSGTFLTLHLWAVGAQIPTTRLVPCSGTGAVTFAPQPTSPTARNATVNVTFVAGQP